MVVEISYRGIRVTQGKLEGDGDPGFLPYEAPLPVGTRVLVHVEGETPREAIVSQVVEQDSSAKSPPGMKLRWAAPAPVITDSVPPAPVPPPPIEAVPEPADSSQRTMMMPAVIVPDEPVEPADSPRA